MGAAEKLAGGEEGDGGKCKRMGGRGIRESKRIDGFRAGGERGRI